jgi:predicted DNA-binding transcriptional regulator YafY
MKHTARQLSETTIADMYRALDARRPVTLTYTKKDGSQTVRTVEIYDIRTTKTGAVMLRAMDRQSGEARTFLVAGIQAYTLHRGRYLIARDEDPTTPVFRTETALTDYEIGRDDRGYWTAKYDREPQPEPADDYDEAA